MSDTKACPYCGEQILAVALKCKHCGSMLGGPQPGLATVTANQLKMRPGFRIALLVIVALFAAGWIYNWSRTGTISGNGFSDEAITKIDQDIRAEFNKRPGLTVEDVQLFRESPRKLTGFAKVKAPLLGTISKSCTATMGDDGRSFWQCQ